MYYTKDSLLHGDAPDDHCVCDVFYLTQAFHRKVADISVDKLLRQRERRFSPDKSRSHGIAPYIGPAVLHGNILRQLIQPCLSFL